MIDISLFYPASPYNEESIKMYYILAEIRKKYQINFDIGEPRASKVDGFLNI